MVKPGRQSCPYSRLTQPLKKTLVFYVLLQYLNRAVLKRLGATGN